MKRDELRDFRMFLKNGGYEQNPTMGGNIIKVARGKTYLGQNEHWQDEMERTMLYLGMEEDENEQPPVADRLRSPRGTPTAARKRAASNLLLSTTPVSKRKRAVGSRLHHPSPRTPGSSNKAAKMFRLHHSSPELQVPATRQPRCSRRLSALMVSTTPACLLLISFFLELRTAWNGMVFFLKTLLTVHFSRRWGLSLKLKRGMQERNKYRLPIWPSFATPITPT